jgi:hypothetical protein
VHINSVYNWINKQYDVKNLRKKYEKIKITNTIEFFILNSINDNHFIIFYSFNLINILSHN